jgi:hypothetical protein
MVLKEVSQYLIIIQEQLQQLVVVVVVLHRMVLLVREDLEDLLVVLEEGPLVVLQLLGKVILLVIHVPLALAEVAEREL